MKPQELEPRVKERTRNSPGAAKELLPMAAQGLLGSKQPLHLAGTRLRLVAATSFLAAWTGTLQAGVISVPNASFESQPAPNPYVPPYVELRVDSWQKTAKPAYWDETANGPWDQLVGLFANTPQGDPSHIDNCTGNQAIYLFSNPQVGIFQDYDSIDWSSSTPSHAFNATFDVGRSYQLTAGFTVSFYRPPTNDATLQMSLYYRDAASNQVTVAATNITNNVANFGTVTHFVDFRVNVPTVKASDAWAGQHIGIAVTCTVTLDQAGGVWDADNVRLTSTRTPELTGSAVTNGQFGFKLESEPGLVFEILGSTNVALPLPNWSSVGFLTNTNGISFYSEPAANIHGRFYRARQLP